MPGAAAPGSRPASSIGLCTSGPVLYRWRPRDPLRGRTPRQAPWVGGSICYAKAELAPGEPPALDQGFDPVARGTSTGTRAKPGLCTAGSGPEGDP